MGICGHLGLAFDPADESTAIACVNGQYEGTEWLRYETDFGLDRENYWEVHLVLQKLAASDASLACLGTTVIGNRAVGEGPYYDMCLYLADEVRQISGAFARIDETALKEAIAEVTNDVDETYRLRFAVHVRETIEGMRQEIEKVSANGWSLIACMI